MAIEATWQAPRFTTYATLRSIYPFIAFNAPINHPQVARYRVQLLSLSENRIDDLGIVPETYKLIPSDSYTILSAYRVRVATISPSGRQSPFTTSATAIASPLRFDFSTQPTARLPSGVVVGSQRLLFLII
jgi:uncharacterized protein YjiS (DUF1127 family)